MAKKTPKPPKAPKPPKEKKPKAEKKPRREVRENPGIGHNVASLRTAGEAFVNRFITLSEQMDSDMGGYRSDFKELYTEAANDLGLKKSVITKELKRILANKKAAEKEAKMAADEREQTELWRTAMEGTQFSLFAEGDLAPAAGASDAQPEGAAPEEE